MTQYSDLIEIYKNYVKLFNNWCSCGIEETDNFNYERLIKTFHNLTDILLKCGLIEPYGIKHYRVKESGEII